MRWHNKRNWRFNKFYWRVIKIIYGQRRTQKHWRSRSSNEETTKCHTLKQQKFKKLSYLKYMPGNDQTQMRRFKQNFPRQMLWNKTSIIKHPQITPQTKLVRRPTQRKSLSAKHTRRNRSKSPSRKQSTTKSNDQPRDQEIAKLKAEIIKKTKTKKLNR